MPGREGRGVKWPVVENQGFCQRGIDIPHYTYIIYTYAYTYIHMHIHKCTYEYI